MDGALTDSAAVMQAESAPRVIGVVQQKVWVMLK
jgi:hypothetical protein